jgi:hypothetical protein
VTAQVRCTLCRHRFAAPAVAVCEKCGSRYIKPIGPVTMDDRIVIALRDEARRKGWDDAVEQFDFALREAGVE